MPAPFPERLRVADNPQQTIRELKELVIAYAKQETVDPLKGLGRYVAFGVAGALLIGTGVTFVALGAAARAPGRPTTARTSPGTGRGRRTAIVVVGALADRRALVVRSGTRKRKKT